MVIYLEFWMFNVDFRKKCLNSSADSYKLAGHKEIMINISVKVFDNC